MEELMHFSHDHPLKLVHLQRNHHYESSDEDDEDKYGDDFVAEDDLGGQCNMCREDIYSFHLSYYNCKDCNYSLHKICAEMPASIQNHPLDPNHKLTLSKGFQNPHPSFTSDTEWMCRVCCLNRRNFFNYYCSICLFSIDIVCATMYRQKINHPSHPHQLQRMSRNVVSHCNACVREHKGTFYYCNICSWFWIHEACAKLPKKLFIQQGTNDALFHPHPLTLAYSFPVEDQKSKFFPRCRVCYCHFVSYVWLYKCDKCRYYVHIRCSTSDYVNFIRPGIGRRLKNFKDDDPNLLHCPFLDESYNLLKHHLLKQKDFKFNQDKMLNHFGHQHPLILLDTQTSLSNKSVLLHHPMKKIQLLCDGCVKPITEMPYYKCSEDVQGCGFVLHELCARLPSKLEDYPGHPWHTLVLLTKIPKKLFGVYACYACWLPSNGFAYGCTSCEYYVDINCAFLPKEIAHEAHPYHLLSRITLSPALSLCTACNANVGYGMSFHCRSCNFYLDLRCAFLLPKMITHKYDKHPLTLRYNPVENHPGDYFCEICEDEFNPESWFYHCSLCYQSMHSSCAPLILDCEKSIYAKNKTQVFFFLNLKFGGTLKMEGHPHRLAFLQGMKCHGQCKECNEELQYNMIFKCLECEYALHYNCASSFGK